MPQDLDQLATQLQRLHGALAVVARSVLEEASRRIGARAVGSYMRDAGPGAGRRAPSDTGPLRIVSGRLARSLTGARGMAGGAPEGIDEITVISEEVVRLVKGSAVPYAAVHEYGFTGAVAVGAHARRTPRGPVQVRAHQRHARIPARPYLNPALADELPAVQAMAAEHLQAAVRTMLAGGVR